MQIISVGASFGSFHIVQESPDCKIYMEQYFYNDHACERAVNQMAKKKANENQESVDSIPLCAFSHCVSVNEKMKEISRK